MDFRTFWIGLGLAERASLAAAAGSTVSYCEQIARGTKQISLGLAEALVAQSGGALQLEDMPLSVRARNQLHARAAVQGRPLAPPTAPVADVSRERLRQVLGPMGAATQQQLSSVLAASPEAVERTLVPMLNAGEVLRAGAAPSFVFVRRVADVTTTGTIPIFKVDADGQVAEFGTMIPTTAGRYWVEERDEAVEQLHEGLPWFLSDMRPQGFLGRAFALAHASLALANHPEHWTDDDVLRALCLAGEDLPGNLLVGANSFQRFVSAQRKPAVGPDAYPALAEAAMQGAAPGSSAGGEQPKFTCVRAADGQPVIVKFSPAGTTEVATRWTDLLVCEHLALKTLNDAGVRAAVTRLTRAGGRTFLESERFDRTPRGRIGMVSLHAYDAEYVGRMDNWAATAERMQRQGLLRPSDADTLRLLEAFGRLIANTDRHYGNVSLLIDAQGSWALAPAYDQLPMLYAPVSDELVAREFDPVALQPTADVLRAWARARQLALQFWTSAASEPMVSKGFRELCARHAQALRGA
jgi:hypothetical protein